MKFKKGDKVKVTDGSFAFGIYAERYCSNVPIELRNNLTIIETELSVTRLFTSNTSNCVYTFELWNTPTERDTICDLLVTDGRNNFWFTQSRLCVSIDKKIEIRYFCDGEDVTDNISDKTKRNLARFEN